MTDNIKNQIAELMQKHHKMSIDEFFNQPMDIRGQLFIPVFMDALGKTDFKAGKLKDDIKKLDAFISEDTARQELMDTFMTTFDELRHAQIQRNPNIAIENITRKALTYYIDVSFGIEDPETLFYNTKTNHHLIEHLFDIFTGHRFNTQYNGLITYVSGYPNTKMCYPNQPIDKIESLDELIAMLKETIRQTATNLKQNRESLIKKVTE